MPRKVRLFKAMAFPSGHVWVWGLDCEESWAAQNGCYWNMVLEKTLERTLDCRGIQQSILKEISFHWKDWRWSWNSNTLAPSWEELTHRKRCWCWEGLGTGGEGDDREWDGWMALQTWWAWVWVNSRSWWWTRRPGEPIHGIAKSWTRLSDWNELNWTELGWASLHCLQVIHFVLIELFISAYCNNFYFCTVSCNLSFFISNLLILIFSLFISVTLTKSLWGVLIFSKH